MTEKESQVPQEVGKESQVRQNYSSDAEKGVNDQINMELYAFYTYLSMVSGV